MDNTTQFMKGSPISLEDGGLLIGIERVFELSGARSPINPKKKMEVYAHVARPVGIEEYALLAIPSGHLLRLGSINQFV